MAKRVGRPKVAASKKRVESFRFVVTKVEAAKVRARCKALNLTLSEILAKRCGP
jgi:hypothetical protein